MAVPRELINQRVAAVVEAQGFDLEDLVITTAGRRRQLRVVVDRDGGMTLDEAAAVSRDISADLDEDDLMGGQPFVLEVTSPGVDRPLTLPRHWRRNHDRLVVAERGDEAESVRGRIVTNDDDTVTLDVEGEQVVVAFDTISRAIVQIEMNRARPSAVDDDDVDDIDDEDLEEEDLEEGDHDGEGASSDRA